MRPFKHLSKLWADIKAGYHALVAEADIEDRHEQAFEDMMQSLHPHNGEFPHLKLNLVPALPKPGKFIATYGDQIAQAIIEMGHEDAMAQWLTITNNPNQKVTWPSGGNETTEPTLITGPLLSCALDQQRPTIAHTLMEHPDIDMLIPSDETTDGRRIPLEYARRNFESTAMVLRMVALLTAEAHCKKAAKITLDFA